MKTRSEGDGSGARPEERDEVTRRGFLTLVTVAAGSLAALVAAVPAIGFVLAPALRRRAGAWRPVGKVDSFTPGQTVKVAFEDARPGSWAGRTGRTAAWLRRSNEGEFTAFAVDCTHLGCPVRWEADTRLFLCPCHGGVYYADGRVAGGPPPRPLTRYPVRVHEGRVEILTEPLPIT